ncbi:MAG: diguanylate cyclase [Hydrogenophilales bacterium]|nr:diguanylate cyclase [Hydrogenophilales bacterium]
MEQSTHPSEVARETIKRLATRKQPPTPENYRRVYLEVQGVERVSANWSEILPRFLKQWEGYQSGLTQVKKREMLERVLINFGNDTEQLPEKLAGLAESWARAGQGAAAEEGTAAVTVPEAHAPHAGASADTGGMQPRLAEVLLHYLDDLSGELSGRWPDLAAECRALAETMTGRSLEEKHISSLAGVWRELLLRAEGDQATLDGLKHLVGLLLENLGEMVSDDAWFSGQMAAMRAIVSGNLSQYALYDAENSLKELVSRQKQLKGGLLEAKEKLRLLVATFIDRIGDITTSTSTYHQRIESYSAQIAKAEDIGELTDVIDHLASDMRQIQGEMQNTHQELLQARQHVEEAELRIHGLESELQEVSAMVREDQLTGALNRRGMDEAFVREEARAQRGAAPFSIALLDIDHFKKLNDKLGHQIGDQALIHLTNVVRTLLRPMDSLARYGGEEFLVLLPNTTLEEAETVMLRLQRELTREFFLHDNQRVLITFSAGVAQRSDDEARDSFIARADAAMYQAKAHGRNRVERG